MKKLILILGLIPMLGFAAVEYDLRKGVDLTATNYRPASLYNQLVDAGTIGATNKGAIIRQNITPNMGDNPRYTNFIFISNAVGTVTAPVIMIWNGTGWIPGSVANNSIGTNQLQDSSVVAGKIAGSAVFGTNIAGNTIQNTNIADTAISGDKIANNGVWNNKFAIGAIKSIDITNSAIQTTNIADNAVTAQKLASDAVGTLGLTNQAVTTAKIALTNITRDLIRNDAIGTSQLTNQAVTSAILATNAVNNQHFATNLPQIMAWGVYTNISGTPGSATLFAGGNVASVTWLANGRSLITFAVPLADTRYGVIASGQDYNANIFISYTNKTTTTFEIRTITAAATLAGGNEVTFKVLR